MTTLELQLEQTRAELRRLSSAVEQLVATTPQRTKQWLEPRELAQLLGISTRTLAVWRTNGRFRQISVRKHGCGYQFHADWALADAQEVSRLRRRSCRRWAAATPCLPKRAKAQLGGRLRGHYYRQVEVHPEFADYCLALAAYYAQRDADAG